MFRSLFAANINWYVYFIFCFFVILIPGISLVSIIALWISIHQFLLLFYSINYVIPIRYLFGFLMCLQMFIGPVLMYNGLEQYQYANYRMQLPEADYFSYALPAVSLFILGLHINAHELRGEILNENELINFIKPLKKLPYTFIIIGFIASFISNYVSSELAFLIYLIGGLKYIGVFILVMAEKKVKPVPMIIVYGSIISSSLGEGMFHDLITWMIFLGAIYCIKYKPKYWVKLSLTCVFIILIVLIQQLKGTYRNDISVQGKSAGIETFNNAFREKSQETSGFFDIANLAPSVTRINQGFIITYIMKNIPEKIEYQNGSEMLQILEAAILPRVLAPNKLRAGDGAIFQKYTGMNLSLGTSMALSSMGDAYLNFGLIGGVIFMFLLGLFYNRILIFFYKNSQNYPLLIIFAPLVFYYPIRPDCELQTILGHVVKSLILLFILVKLWNKYFKIQYPFPNTRPKVAV